MVHESLLVDRSDCRQQLCGTAPHALLLQPNTVLMLQKVQQAQFVVLADYSHTRPPAVYHVDVLGQVRMSNVLAVHSAARGGRM